MLLLKANRPSQGRSLNQNKSSIWSHIANHQCLQVPYHGITSIKARVTQSVGTTRSLIVRLRSKSYRRHRSSRTTRRPRKRGSRALRNHQKVNRILSSFLQSSNKPSRTHRCLKLSSQSKTSSRVRRTMPLT